MAKEIQNAGILHADAEKSIEKGQDQGQHGPPLAQCQDGQQASYTQHSDVPQLP